MRAVWCFTLASFMAACGPAAPTTRVLDGIAPPAPVPIPEDTSDFRKTRPPPGDAPRVRLPRVEDARLSNGVRVLLAPRPGLPIVAIELVVDRGSDQAALGVGSLFGAMLVRGTTTKKHAQIRSALAGFGAIVGSSTSEDATNLSLRVLTPVFQPALGLATEMLRSSDLPDDQLDALRTDWIRDLEGQADTPARVLGEAVVELLYPDRHPYRVTRRSFAEALRNARRADLAAFQRANVQPDSTTVAIAGDYVRAEVLRELEKLLGGWRGRAAPKAPAPTAPKLPSAPRLVVFHQPGLTQAHIAIAWVGIARGAPDQLAFQWMVALLDRRLDMNLRQRHGYTYRATTQYSLRRGAGPFQATAAVAREHTVAALREILAELERIRTTEPSATERGEAGREAWAAVAAQLETPTRVARSLATTAAFDLPLFEGLPAQSDHVSNADMRRVAIEHLPAEAATVVIVGDVTAMEPGLETLGLGRPEVRSAPRRVVEELDPLEHR